MNTNKAPRGYKVVYQIVQTTKLLGAIVVGQFADKADAEMVLGTRNDVRIVEAIVRK